MLGLASCQKDTAGLDVIVDGEQETTISVSLSEATRANSALGAVDNEVLKEYDLRYILEIYDGANRIKRMVNVEDNSTTTAFDVRLIPGYPYTFVAWADFVKQGSQSDNYYNTDDGLTAVTANFDNNGNWIAMTEARDAYTGKHYEESYSSTSNITLKLKRPFAKLRVVTNDMDVLTMQNKYPQSVSVTYNDVYTGFNAFAQTVCGNVEDVTASYDIKNAENKTAYDETGSTLTLLADYLFGAADDTIQFTMNTKIEDNHVITTNFNTDIPLERNKVTTIKGNILTDGNDIKIDVNDDFDQSEEILLWDGKTVEKPNVSAEDANIYVIEKPSELAWLAAAVNGTLTEDYTRSFVDANDFAGKTFVLTQDIDLNNEPWTPIGDTNHIFKGTFDGQGHTITNLVVNGGTNSNQGLFGVTHDGEIKNFTLVNAKVSGRTNVGAVCGQPYTSKYTDITVNGHVEVNGMAYVGGVGGKNAYADWTRIYVNVDETSYVKANSIENGTAYRTYVGGVVGFNGEGTHKFSNIESNINVIGSTCDVGGLFGIAHYGNQFENCVCTGDVEIYAAEEAAEAEEIGGIAGVWHNQNDTTVTMTNVKFTSSVTTNIARETVWYNNLVGKPYSATGTGKLYLNGYEMVANGVGVKDGAYYVFNADGLRWIGETVNAGNSFANKTINLVNDITLNGEWTPIGNSKHFMGTFNGQDKTISGMTITKHNGSNPKALFGIVSGTVSIKNLTIDNANVAMEDNFDGDFYAAGLIGTYYGSVTIENVTVKNSTFVGNNKVAGLLAHDGVCSNLCINNCKVLDCAISSANYTDGGNVGGLLGLFQGAANGNYKIENSSVKGCTITGINSSDNGKRANSEFVACVNSKVGQTLVIENCVVENNTFTQTTNGTAAVTYVGPYDNKFVGGERNDYAGETLKGVVIIDGVKYDNATQVASWDEFTAALAAGKTNIKLTDDITYDANYQLQKDVVIDLNGKSMTLPMINIHTKTTIKNGTINGKVYARKNAEIVFNNVKFSGAVADNLSTEGHLAIQGGCKSLYAKDCLFSPTSVSGSQTKPLSFEGGSTVMKFENCEFKSSPYKKQVYFNSLSATGSLDFTNCNFNNKTPNIMFAAACPLTNLTMSGTTKLGSVTLETNRAKDAVTAEDLAYLRESLIANNSMSSVRLFYAGGSSEYIR